MKAAIFDMDGLLIDSEPLWRRAEKKVFGGVGVPLTEKMCEETMGYRIEEVVQYWYKRYLWQGKSCRDVQEEILSTTAQLIATHGKPMKGVRSVLRLLRAHGLMLGLASSSPRLLIEATLTKFAIVDFFDVLCTAVDEEHGKPHPAVYLSTAQKLGVKPNACIVFEDSVAGVRAAKAAGMMTIAIPAPNMWLDERYSVADLKLRSLKEFDVSMLVSAFEMLERTAP